MCGMLESVNDFIHSTVGNMPLAIVTILLIAAPTLLYALYRITVPAVSHGRSRTSSLPNAQWVCPACKSVNDLTARRCYRCTYDVDQAEDVLVIDPVTAKPIVLPSPGVAVGPGPARGPGVPVGPGLPTGPTVPLVAPVRTAAAVSTPAGSADTQTIGSAVGARRPFDATPPATPGAADSADRIAADPLTHRCVLGASRFPSAPLPDPHG